MRFLAVVVLVVGCALPAVPPAPGPAESFQACDPGDPVLPPGETCDGGGGSGGQSTCNRLCSSNTECGGATQLCRFCSFGECKSTAPLAPAVDAGTDATR